VLNFLDQIDNQVKGFRLQYERLCEFSHPNWAGTTLFYSKHDREKRATDFCSRSEAHAQQSLVGQIDDCATLIFALYLEGTLHQNLVERQTISLLEPRRLSPPITIKAVLPTTIVYP
jgi:hypothetical protein